MQIKVGSSENQMINTNLQTQETAAREGGRKAAKQQRKATIFAGDLPLHKDSIALRRQQAQKQAMKFVQDAWSGDRKVDQGQEQVREIRELQQEEVIRNQELVRECEDRKENLRQQYGVDADSQEQKDLEAMMEAARYRPETRLPIPPIPEEVAEWKEPEEKQLTEYQKKCLEINEEQIVFERRLQNAEDNVAALQSSLTDMKVERLKYHKMTDAQNNAEKVMEQAGKEIQGMLVDEAKDHVDEAYEEKREEEEEKAEEKEAEEEKIELRKEQKELLEARIDAVREDSHEAEDAQKAQERDAREEASLLKDMAEAGLDVAGAGAAVQAEIKDMLNKMKLLEADIKGIEVDEEV